MIFPAQVCTLPDLIRFRAEVQPGQVAICDGDRTTTYGQLDQQSSRVAQSLYQHGLTPGERVGVLDRDCDDLFTVVFGISKASGVVLGMDWRLTAVELAFQLQDAEVRTLFVGSEFVGIAEGLMGLCPKLRTVVTFGQHDRGWTTLADFIEGMPAANPCAAVDPESVAVQMYTSGTTGKPKGVMLAHRSFFAITGELGKAKDPWIGWHEHDVTMCGMPSFHIGGMWWAVTSFHAGACYVVLDSFSGWKALRKIERHLVTKLCLVPAMIQVCMSEPEFAAADVSSVECIVYGGSPIPRPLLEQAIRAFGCDFAQIYGLTETGNTAVCLRPADHRNGRLLTAAGRPYPGVALKVVDGAGQSVAAGVVGEICIKSPANMVGYYNRPDATAATLRSGWVHTGDAGLLDENGYVFVNDRVKDMISSAGENIYPAEVESVLAGHPSVAEIGVIGVPHDSWGEQVHAVVVLRPATSLGLQELQEFGQGQLASFKLPRSMSLADELPRTPSGKIKKAELRAPYWRGRERSVQ